MTRPLSLFALLSSLFLLLPHLPFALSVHRVAIVGGGIGGAGCAYYLNQFAPQGSVAIDVFEKEDQLGGRLKHVVFGGEVCEVGGDAWSSVNSYLMEIKKVLNVPISNDSFDGNGQTGFYQGNQKWFQIKESIFTEAKFLLQVEIFRYHLLKNYDIRGDTPFSSIEEFVQDGGLDAYTSVSMQDFLSGHKINENMVDGEIWPIIRGIYDQNLTVSAFAGIVSVLPALTDAYSVMGGNSRVVEMMFNNSTANINLDSTVTQINWNGIGYEITLTNGTVSSTYDSVVIAHPIEFGNIKYTNVTLAPYTTRHYQHWYVTLILATGLQPSYFGTTLNPIPDNVFTTGNSTAPFVVIYPIAQASNGDPIYKIFSNVDMIPYLNSIFIGMSNYTVQVWPYTFPDLQPQSTYQPINLANGLYYLNTLESVASTMETSIISGRNSALLIKNSL